MHIIIETESGEKVISDNWPGHWKTPMTDKEMSLKFESCCSRFWSKDETLIHENFILNITETDYLSSIIKELTKLS